MRGKLADPSAPIFRPLPFMYINREKWYGIYSVVLVYAAFASLWILFSDQALLLVTRDPAQIIELSMFKGWTFVAVTSLLLYGLLTRYWRRHTRVLAEQLAERTHALEVALEAAEAANQAKSVFLSNMSHELRTPLNAVIGFSRLLARSTHLDEKERKNVGIINRSGNHLLTLINDVLELSKIEAGQASLTEANADIGELAREVVDMLKPKAEQSGLCLNLELSALPIAVRADAMKLRQILINLLGNAVKFTQQGSVSLTVRGRGQIDGKAFVEFAVRDTGIGIAAADRQKVFEPFAQLVTPTTAAGTGLGLSITLQYLRMMGSELALESFPGRGSCFSFTLQLPVTIPPASTSDNATEMV